eukprot:gb/GFBE01061484.1/.p1 GENE.gb/GFBE01061484.1/~~gb/GFBE01061484.1/.p1  ORF type:complete len:378 (+),score=63.63 gb/GFBE01061484.1/:1-1134(+)
MASFEAPKSDATSSRSTMLSSSAASGSSQDALAVQDDHMRSHLRRVQMHLKTLQKRSPGGVSANAAQAKVLKSFLEQRQPSEPAPGLNENSLAGALARAGLPHESASEDGSSSTGTLGISSYDNSNSFSSQGQGPRHAGKPSCKWFVVWCHEHCHKACSVSTRDAFQNIALSCESHLVCLKKAMKYAAHVKTLKKPHLLLTDWREVKPCITAMTEECAAGSPPNLPFAIVVLVECSKSFKAAKAWASLEPVPVPIRVLLEEEIQENGYTALKSVLQDIWETAELPVPDHRWRGMMRSLVPLEPGSCSPSLVPFEPGSCYPRSTAMSRSSADAPELPPAPKQLPAPRLLAERTRVQVVPELSTEELHDALNAGHLLSF